MASRPPTRVALQRSIWPCMTLYSPIWPYIWPNMVNIRLYMAKYGQIEPPGPIYGLLASLYGPSGLLASLYVVVPGY